HRKSFWRLIPARVTNSAVYGDVALLRPEQASPPGAVAARLRYSDQVEVGDQILVVGAPNGLSATPSVTHSSGGYRPGNKVMGAWAIEFLQTDAAINSGNPA